MSSEAETVRGTMNPRHAAGRLPRLLYVGEVDVQAYCHGSLLLYRLLQSYPHGSLQILETSAGGSEAPRRLVGVPYHHAPVRGQFLFHNRHARAYAGLLPKISAKLSGAMASAMKGLSWDALLTVAHGHSWVRACDLAVEMGRPVHLVIHDDWPRYAASSPAMRRRLEAEFAPRYRGAASRLCVSPMMEREYHDRYLARGTVLYPARSQELQPAESAHAKNGALLKKPVLAFAGTVATPGQARLLKLCSQALEPLGGRLLVYGPITPEDMRRHGLDAPNVEPRGLIPSREIVRELSREADLLYLPMSFDAADTEMIRINFPSKLTDYTATGLPVVICAPPHSSAAVWAGEQPDAAVVVEREDAAALRATLEALCREPRERQRLAAGALRAGAEYFSPERAQRVFQEAILSA